MKEKSRLNSILMLGDSWWKIAIAGCFLAWVLQIASLLSTVVVSSYGKITTQVNFIAFL